MPQQDSDTTRCSTTSQETPVPSVDELIARLEEAERGSRHLDWAIHGAPSPPAPAYDWANVPAYTTSVDAALTLVPAGFVLYQLTIWPNDPDGFDARVEVWGTHKEYGRGSNPRRNYRKRATDPRGKGKAKTAPLAICIAALKARQTGPQPERVSPGDTSNTDPSPQTTPTDPQSAES